MLPHIYRLPAAQRLHHPLFRKTPLFSVKIAKNNMDVSRYAFLVRKSIDKRAVVRNRIRRVFRSCIEDQLQNIKPGYDMLFFLEKGIMDKPKAEVSQTLQQFLREQQLFL